MNSMSIIESSDLERIFTALDLDGDGRLSAAEMSGFLAKAGVSANPEEVEAAVGRESLDFHEFAQFYEAEMGPEEGAEAGLREAFKVFDEDGDGVISGAELQRVLRRLGLWEQSGGDCAEMIGRFDANSDGVLDFEEFKGMMLCAIA